MIEEKHSKRFKEYLELRYSPSTVRQYLWAFNSFNTELRTQAQLNTFIIEKMRKRNDNPFYSGFLKSYIDCFQLDLGIPKSKKKNKRIPKEHKFLTKEQIDTIIAGTSPYISLMVRLYFETGLRLRELLNARIEDIDVLGRSIRGVGKNNTPFDVKFSTETGKVLDSFLQDVREASPDMEYPFHFSYFNPLCNAKDPAGRFHYYLHKECLAAGVNGVHAHRLRHALGHHLRADKGFDLKQIQKKLRHAMLETTSIYTEATQKEVDDKIDEEVFT